MNYMPRRTFVAALLLVGVGLPSAVRAQGSPQTSGAVTLFENVRIFDGKSAALSAPSNVLVRGNKIGTISSQPIAADRRADTRIIAGGGRTLMPGLIDVIGTRCWFARRQQRRSAIPATTISSPARRRPTR